MSAPVSSPSPSTTTSPWPVLAVAVIGTGVLSGLGGTALSLLLHMIQHLAYGYGQAGGPHNFLQGVSAAPAWRRVAALCAAGLVAGVGWWALGRFGQPLISIAASVGKTGPGKPMPPLSTLVHVLLQIVTVALGSPLGREVAPRELGAVLATGMGRVLRLAADDRRIIIACGAGAGLSAVYNVPLGGALFILEVLLAQVGQRAVMCAVGASAIGAFVPWAVLGNVHQYEIGPMVVTPAVMVWALCAGPVIGIGAHGVKRLAGVAQNHAARGVGRVGWCLVVFPLMGVLTCFYPQLPGNGRGPMQLALSAQLGMELAATLLVLKILVIMGALRAGAAGGLLTPSLTMGALLASVLAAGWNLWFPAVDVGTTALLGGIAFLGTFMAMPLTALALGIEFTHVGHDMWVPIFLTSAGALLAFRICARVGGPMAAQSQPHAPGSMSARS
ncbi:chloride channel protein [Komagataeibacter sp. FNDCR2]|uniref:chloride channel protein n=1 Tax=Komagataeibacter sp. FNDCR2 TaxID=2878682 RepID=UPI001E4181E6|nr:chloride channel protein [Komagataeibacter sp. FNDCR2]MCE2575503.1 chloride channel protein [Komagataeibacter sp. FNDCR2]